MPLWSHLKPLESVNTAQIIQCSLFVAPDVALCDTLTIHACTCDSLKGGGGGGGGSLHQAKCALYCQGSLQFL